MDAQQSYMELVEKYELPTDRRFIDIPHDCLWEIASDVNERIGLLDYGEPKARFIIALRDSFSQKQLEAIGKFRLANKLALARRN